MNLLTDAWIQIACRSGVHRRISPLQILGDPDDPVAEILAPRADFRGALFELLIGLYQTVLAPADLDAWWDLWQSPPEMSQLERAFAPWRNALQLEGNGPLFMQDRSVADADPISVAGLLIDAPGEKTIHDSNDHFIHRDTVRDLCPSCAAMALLTLQLHAPSGGQGHRVSLRGGGPLTTLRQPLSDQATLWQRIWANVLPQNALDYPEVTDLAAVLPWLGTIRTSEPKTGVDTTPESVHPLQAYWSMPRRILLDFSVRMQGLCSLCGAQDVDTIRQYRTRNYGVNYSGAWLHPLTPYSHDSKEEKLPLSIKGQKGGIGYSHWLGLALGNAERKPEAAQVVRYFSRMAYELPKDVGIMRLWCFGYDLDNAKARAYYDAYLPLYTIPQEVVPAIAEAVKLMIDLAVEYASLLQKQVKSAHFDRPGEVKGDPAVPQSFWQSTETGFYAALEKLMAETSSLDGVTAGVFREWYALAGRAVVSQFDQWILAAPVEAMKTRRVVQARADLLRMLTTTRAAKSIRQRMHSDKEMQA